MTFKYLGVEISSSSDLYSEVREQTNKASALSGCLRNVIWNNKHVRIQSKVRIYKTCIRPVMTYGIETRADTTRTKNLLRTTEMKTLRAIAGVSLRDRIRNEEIRRTCDIEDIVRWGRARRRFWRDHVDRMNNTRIPYIAANQIPHGHRPPGRPPKRWKDSWSSTSQEQPSLSRQTDQ